MDNTAGYEKRFNALCEESLRADKALLFAKWECGMTAKEELLAVIGDLERLAWIELRYNPYHDEYGRFASADGTAKRYSNGGAKYGNDKKPEKALDKSENSGIIKSSDIFTEGMSVKLPDGGHGVLVNGGKITKIVAFAGKGTNKPIKIAKGLSERFSNDESDWIKNRGDGYVKIQDGSVKHSELHWFYSKKTGIFDLKVKRYFDDES